MIKIAITLFLGRWLFNTIRRWRRERAAERDWARRIVPRPAGLVIVRNPVDMALWREQMIAQRDATDAARAAKYWAKIKRNQAQWEANERRLYG